LKGVERLSIKNSLYNQLCCIYVYLMRSYSFTLQSTTLQMFKL